MNRLLFSTLALGWVGSLTSWLTLAHPLLSLVATLLAAVASLYAITVAWRTARLRDLEITDLAERLCERCRLGHPPAQCPFPPEKRPKNCPRRDVIPTVELPVNRNGEDDRLENPKTL